MALLTDLPLEYAAEEVPAATTVDDMFTSNWILAERMRQCSGSLLDSLKLCGGRVKESKVDVAESAYMVGILWIEVPPPR